MKKFLLVFVAAILVLFLVACDTSSTKDTISKSIGIDISHGQKISNYDTHSGNGDGTSCVAFRFDDDEILEQIRENNTWNMFPLSDTVTTLVYGISDQTSRIGPFLSDQNGKALVPMIKNGYYLLIDRQAKEDELQPDILHRASFNLTLTLYDTDTKTLYVCKLDT